MHYCLSWFAAVWHPAAWNHPSWPFIGDCMLDVAAKMLYAHKIKYAHFSATDQYERQLSLWVRESMSVIWSASPDTLIISRMTLVDGQKASRRVQTLASPSLVQLLGAAGLPWLTWRAHELMPDDSWPVAAHASATPANQKEIISGTEEGAIDRVVNLAWRDALSHATSSFAWRVLRCGDAPSLHLQVNMTLAPGETVLVIVVSDCTDRVALHEAETALLVEKAAKEAIAQQVSRQKMEEANRFTRHEVKNGVLAAMADCETLRELHERAANEAAGTTDVTLPRLTLRGLADMASKLERTLNTVLAEAMARELVHGVYDAQPEAVALVDLLHSCLDVDRADRFVIVTDPDPLPALSIDPRLVYHIYRNVRRRHAAPRCRHCSSPPRRAARQGLPLPCARAPPTAERARPRRQPVYRVRPCRRPPTARARAARRSAMRASTGRRARRSARLRGMRTAV